MERGRCNEGENPYIKGGGEQGVEEMRDEGRRTKGKLGETPPSRKLLHNVFGDSGTPLPINQARRATTAFCYTFTRTGKDLLSRTNTHTNANTPAGGCLSTVGRFGFLMQSFEIVATAVKGGARKFRTFFVLVKKGRSRQNDVSLSPALLPEFTSILQF
ncbi:hypothetical protein Trydic_g20984 [Trypoxylus dichotomus]